MHQIVAHIFRQVFNNHTHAILLEIQNIKKKKNQFNFFIVN